MKKKNWILNLVLAVLIAIPAMLLTACGGNKPPVQKSAWGRTFTFQGTVTNDLSTSDGSSSKSDLIRANYPNNLNLSKATINSVEVDLSALGGDGISFDQFIANLKTKASDALTAKCSNVIVKVGTEEEKTITINNVTYSLEQSSGNYYNIKPNDSATGLNWVGGINVMLKLDNDNPSLNDSLELNVFGIEGVMVETLSILIPTISRIDDSRAQDMGDGTTAISIEFKPYFNEAAN